MNDYVETRLIVTKRRQYVMPLSAGRPWAEVYPNRKPPMGRDDLKVWDTPDGRVVTRPDDDLYS